MGGYWVGSGVAGDGSISLYAPSTARAVGVGKKTGCHDRDDERSVQQVIAHSRTELAAADSVHADTWSYHSFVTEWAETAPVMTYLHVVRAILFPVLTAFDKFIFARHHRLSLTTFGCW